MNRIIKKMAAGLMTLAVMAAVFGSQMLMAFAATGKITFSDPTATVGNQVSVTMKINTADGNLGESDVMVEYDASALEFLEGTNTNGGAGQIRVMGSMESANQTTFSFTLKFKALKAGTTTLKVTSQEVYDADSQTVSISHVGTSTVKINAATTASKNANLSSLTISPGQLSPAFSPEVTEYTATVAGVDSIAVSAPAADGNASVSVSGSDNIQMGENTVVCKVTAEDGETTKEYTITVTKVEESELPSESETESSMESVAPDPVENWTVSETFDAGLLPSGFTSTEVHYGGMDVQAGVNENGQTIIYMTDENGNGDFFLYDRETGMVAPYVTVMMAEKTIIVLPPSEMPEGTTIPEGFLACTIDIGSHTVDGWIWEGMADAPEYCVVYGMNENGEKNLYRYDQKEMTLQRYFDDPVGVEREAKLAALVEEYNSLVDDYDLRGILIAVLFGVCIVLVIILIVLLMRNSKTPSGGGNGRGGRKAAGGRRGDDDYGYEYERAERAGRAEKNGRGGKGKAPVRQESDRKVRDYEDMELELEDLDLDDEGFEERPARREAPAPERRPAPAGRTAPERRPAPAGRPVPERRPAPAGRSAPGRGAAPAKNVSDVERDLKAGLAKEAQSMGRADEADDDFEFIDLDL